jgi:hypothetical protein
MFYMKSSTFTSVWLRCMLPVDNILCINVSVSRPFDRFSASRSGNLANFYGYFLRYFFISVRTLPSYLHILDRKWILFNKKDFIFASHCRERRKNGNDAIWFPSDDNSDLREMSAQNDITHKLLYWVGIIKWWTKTSFWQNTGHDGWCRLNYLSYKYRPHTMADLGYIFRKNENTDHSSWCRYMYVLLKWLPYILAYKSVGLFKVNFEVLALTRI